MCVPPTALSCATGAGFFPALSSCRVAFALSSHFPLGHRTPPLLAPAAFWNTLLTLYSPRMSALSSLRLGSVVPAHPPVTYGLRVFFFPAFFLSPRRPPSNHTRPHLLHARTNKPSSTPPFRAEIGVSASDAIAVLLAFSRTARMFLCLPTDGGCTYNRPEKETQRCPRWYGIEPCRTHPPGCTSPPDYASEANTRVYARTR